MVSSSNNVGAYLEKKFLEWQTGLGERKTLSAFADYLGISKGVLGNYMNGSRKPNEENLTKIAARLGFEIYDILDIPRPDSRLTAIIERWGEASEQLREKIEHIFLEELGRDSDDEGRKADNRNLERS